MNTATMDGSRALYGIAKDGMTIKELGVLNRYSVPGRAMTMDAILNIFLITVLRGTRWRSWRSATSATCSRTCTALSAFPAAAQGPAAVAAADQAAELSGCRWRRCCS